MSNFVKLPSGRGVNVEGIHAWFFNDKNGIFLNLTMASGEVVQYQKADARALNAYLSTQAVTIGEDGKPVEAEAPKAEISEVQRAVLEWMSDYCYLSFNLSQIRDHFDITEPQMHQLHESGLVYGSRKTKPEVWFITDEGRSAVTTTDTVK